MMLLSRHPASKPYLRSEHRNQGAFTLVEILAATALFGMVAAVVIWGLTMLQNYATIARLYTAAQTLAQNQIDVILTKGPFNPTAGTYPNPNVLRIDASYYSDPGNGSTSTAPIYVTIHKQADGQQTVRGTVKTTVSETGHEYPVGTSLKVRQAVVEVAYTYRSKDYTVVMNTMRAPDQ